VVLVDASTQAFAPAGEREKANLIVLFADEGQEIITGAESAFADHRAAGIIREARATIVLATQAYTSLHGSLDLALRRRPHAQLEQRTHLYVCQSRVGLDRLEEHR